MEQLNPLGSLFKNHNSVVLFDTETTGLDCESCEIIELAALTREVEGCQMVF